MPKTKAVAVEEVQQKEAIDENQLLLNELNEAARIKRQKDDLEEKYEILTASLLDRMTRLRKRDFTNDFGDKVEVREKQNSVVNTTTFQEHVTPEEFVNSIKVSVTKAKELLPQRLWNEVIVYTGTSRYVQITPSKINF